MHLQTKRTPTCPGRAKTIQDGQMTARPHVFTATGECRFCTTRNAEGK